MSTRPPDDLVQPFQLEPGTVRGRLVRLGPAIDAILCRHDYPEPVAVMLGELLVLAAVFAGALKFDGLLTLQTQSDGPISMMVADFATPGELRGYARYDRAALSKVLDSGRPPAGPVPRLLGAGHLAFTVDLGPDTELYQGYVELAGATLAECAHSYFRQSEQLEAGVRLAVARLKGGERGSRWRAGGLMVQSLPAGGGTARVLDGDEEREDAWRQALTLVGTLEDRELTDPALVPNEILYRLFHQSGVRVYRPRPLEEGCRCSRERVRRMLESFKADELADMVVEERIVVTCQFCNAAFAFAEGDIAALARP